MKITVAAFAYNEIKYLPYFVEFYRNQGCDLLILDNCSTDGTYEWLVENNITTFRVFTDDSFHLKTLQDALMERLIAVNPDWVVYAGIDIFYFFSGTIVSEIGRASTLGYNSIETRSFAAYNVGEPVTLPFHKNHFHVQQVANYQMISKYGEGFRFNSDNASVWGNRPYISDGFFINYGMCKPSEEREETFNRRKRAWDQGLKRSWGTHYRGAKKRNWIWKPESLLDIREMKEIDFINKVK